MNFQEWAESARSQFGLGDHMVFTMGGVGVHGHNGGSPPLLICLLVRASHSNGRY